MKRLWVAAVLLCVAAGLCLSASLYQHRQIDRMLDTLDRLETAYNNENTAEAYRFAECLVREYRAVGRVLYCFIAHSDLAASQETVTLLPALLQHGGQEELTMEIARLREQLLHLREIDDPLWQNIL